MSTKDEWILFLEKNPQFHELSRSTLYMSILRLLTKSSLHSDKVHAAFPKIENKDIDLILDSLLKLKLVSKLVVGGQFVYTVTSLGRELLDIYTRARKGFKIE